MRQLVTALLLISAGFFYAIGFDGGVVAAIIAAVALEILLWTRVIRFGRPSSIR